VKTGLAAGAVAGAGSLSFAAPKQTATDWVALGDSGVKVTRLAFGTGSMGGQVQRDLGQEAFTRTVRYASTRVSGFSRRRNHMATCTGGWGSRCRGSRATATS
jgi:hypothetical protein